MAVAFPTPDAALVTRLASGDQAALTALYRQAYDALVSRASDALGPDLAHFSGRVAEKAMLNAWQARARFQNPMALTDYLEDAVKTETDIQKRKHTSLHRRDGQHVSTHVTVPSVDEAVAKLTEALSPVDHEKAMAEAREMKKAHTKEHVQRVGGRPKWIVPTVLTAVAVVAIIGLQKYLDKAGVDAAIDRALKAEGTQTTSSGKGQRGSLTLRDGTKVAIGSDSKLRVPEEFATPKMRTIALEGTATFTVGPAAAGPDPLAFSVRAGDATFTATGGVFTVRNYEEDGGVVSLDVKEGSVDVKDRESGKSQTVAAGSAITFTKGVIAPLEGVKRDVAMAWTRDSLVFDNQPLKVVLPELVRWFSLNAAIADPTVNDRPVSMRIALSSSGDATKALTTAANLAIQFGKDDRIEFNDASKASAPAKK
jgi:ferric-dicitrate binding protein FerR (iron transport regulator)